MLVKFLFFTGPERKSEKIKKQMHCRLINTRWREVRNWGSVCVCVEVEEKRKKGGGE